MAGESTLSLTYKDLLTSTLFGYLDSGKFTDNISDITPTWGWLMDNARMTRGGERISVAIQSSLNTTAGSYSNYDSLDVTPQDNMTRAFFDNKQYSVTISINGNEMTANMGEAEIFDLLMSKTAIAEASLGQGQSEDVFLDGTGNSSKDITGLAALNDQTPAVGTYGSINRANLAAWRNGAATSIGAAATGLLSNLRTEYNTASKKSAAGKPDWITTTQTVHETFEALMFPFLQYQGSATSDNSVNAGLSNLRYKNASVAWDPDVPSGELHILNSNHTWLVVHPDRNYSMAEGGFQKPVDQDALSTQVLWKGNLVTDLLAANAVLAGLT